MRGLEFPIVGTKVKGLSKKFDLNDPEIRKKYFEAKVGSEIDSIDKFFKAGNSFIAYLLGKKNSGKGTYAKLFTEVFGEDKVAHLSIGDIVRAAHQELETEKGRKEVEAYLERKYRGYISIEQGIKAILNRSQEKVSVPNELILSLIEREIDKHLGKALFIDGFPRTLDQVSYSLFFRDLMGYRDDPDLFILIDIPETVIDARIKTRVICPKCNIPRNLKLLPTSKIGYDKEDKEFYLVCDNPDCTGKGSERLVRKEGDDAGIEPIRERLVQDEEILRTAFSLYGVPKIFLRNHVSVKDAKKYFDDYEITPEFSYSVGKDGKIIVQRKPWIVKDDNQVASYSLMPSPVVVSMIKQLVEVLGL